MALWLSFKEIFENKKKDSIHLMTRQRWTAKDYYFDLDGHIIWGKDEYQIDLRKLR